MYLFSPIKIGTLELKNRLVVPAMATQYCDIDGKATERFISYLETRAKGGWGLIIPENYAVDPHGKAFMNVAGLWSDEQIPGHKELVERVHSHGAKICCQLYHAGRATHPKAADGQTVAPSAVKDFTRRDIPRALTVEEIRTIVKRFGDAAERAKAAGFDMLELHGAHGYLIAQFLSLFSNKRADMYGGSLNNRYRFLAEIIREIRGRVGDDFPIQLRISVREYLEGGLDIGESRAIARLAESAGIDGLHVSQGHHASSQHMIQPYAVARAAYAENAARIKAAVRVPVIGVGRINDPFVADALLASGDMDLVAMGRASLADPELPNKLREGRLDELRYCFGCLQGCRGQRIKGGRDGIRCLANPEVGHEFEHPRKPAEIKKTVLVAGGGITGCEAAILAAERGHTVSLWESTSELGGQWTAAGMAPGKAEFNTMLFRQQTRLKQLNVAVHLNSPVTEDILCRVKPDVLLVAAGGLPIRPHIPGSEGSHVATAQDVLTGRVKTGKKVVVIGGGLAGAETADFAADQGAVVSVIEILPEIAKGGEYASNLFLFDSLKRHGVQIHTEATCKQIGEDFVLFEIDGDARRIDDVDQVILATGVRPNNELCNIALKLNIETIAIGDAAEVKDGLHNIWEAFDTTAKI